MKSNQQIAEDIYGLLHGRMVTTILANDDIGLITKALDIKDQERKEAVAKAWDEAANLVSPEGCALYAWQANIANEFKKRAEEIRGGV